MNTSRIESNTLLIENSWEKLVIIGTAFIVCSLVFAAIFAKRYYISLTQDRKLLHYNKFSFFFRTGCILFSASVIAILISKMILISVEIVGIVFVIGGLLLYFSVMYILDKQKFPNMSESAKYVLRPVLLNAQKWIIIALIGCIVLFILKIFNIH